MRQGRPTLGDKIRLSNPGSLIVAGILIGTGVGCAVGYVGHWLGW